MFLTKEQQPTAPTTSVTNPLFTAAAPTESPLISADMSLLEETRNCIITLPTDMDSFINQPLKKWILSKRQLYNRCAFTEGLEQAILLIESIEQLHSRNCFLMDQFLASSVFVAEDGYFCFTELKPNTNPLLDRMHIFQRYIDSLKRHDSFDLFLYPPEYFESVIFMRKDVHQHRLKKDDIWPFGIILLLLVGYHENEVPTAIAAHKFTRYESSDKQYEMMNSLLKSIFSTTSDSRPNFKEALLQIRAIHFELTHAEKKEILMNAKALKQPSFIYQMVKTGQLNLANEHMKKLQEMRELSESEEQFFDQIKKALKLIPLSINQLTRQLFIPFTGECHSLAKKDEPHSYLQNVLKFKDGCSEVVDIFEKSLSNEVHSHNPLLICAYGIANRKDQRSYYDVQAFEKIRTYNDYFEAEYQVALYMHIKSQMKMLKAETIKGYSENLLIDYADVLFQDNSYDESISVLLQAIKQYPNCRNKSVRMWLLFGQCYAMLNDEHQAIESWLQGVKLLNSKGQHAEQKVKYALYTCLGDIYRKQGNIDNAILYYLKSSQNYETVEQSKRGLGSALEIASTSIYKQFELIEKMLSAEISSKEHHDYTEYLIDLMSILSKQLQMNREVIQIWESRLDVTFINEKRKATVCLDIGRIYESLKNTKKAEECYCASLAADKSMYQAHFRLSRIYELSHPDKARHHAIEGLSLHSNAEVSFRLGVLEKKMNNFKESLAAFTDCIAICDMGFPAIYEHLGDVYKNLNLQEESCACFEVNYKLSLNKESNQMQYGLMLFQSKQYSQALQVLVNGKTKVRLDAIKTSELVHAIGECYYMLGDFNNACMTFKRIFKFTSSMNQFMLCIEKIWLYLTTKQDTFQLITALKSHLSFQKIHKEKKQVWCILAFIYLANYEIPNALEYIQLAETVDSASGLLPIVKAKYFLIAEKDHNFLINAQLTLDSCSSEIKTSNAYTIVDWEIKAKAKQYKYLRESIDSFDIESAAPYMLTYYNYIKAILLASGNPRFTDDSYINKSSPPPSVLPSDIKQALDLIGRSEYPPSCLLGAQLQLYMDIDFNDVSLKEVINKFPCYIDAIRSIYLLYAATNNFKQLEVIMHKLLSLTPNDIFAHNRLAEAHLANNKFKLAVAELEKSFAIDPENERTLLLLIKAYSMEKQHKKAAQIANQYLQIWPNSIDVLQMLSQEYFNLGNYAKAMSSIQQVFGLGSTKIIDYLLLGRIQIEENDYVGLQSTFDLISKAEEDNEDFQVLLTLGQWAKLLGDIKGAINYYERCLAITPNDKPSLEGLMMIHLEKKSKTEFQQLFEKFPKLVFTNPSFIAAVSIYFIKQNNLKIVKDLQKNVQKEAGTSCLEFQYSLALTNYLQKAYNKAHQHIQACEKLLKSCVNEKKVSINKNDFWFLRAAIAQLIGEPIDKVYYCIAKLPERSPYLDMMLAELEVVERKDVATASLILEKYSKEPQLMSSNLKFSYRKQLVEFQIEQTRYSLLDKESQEREARQYQLKTQKILEQVLINHNNCEYTVAMIGLLDFQFNDKEQGIRLLEKALELASANITFVYQKPLSQAMKISLNTMIAEYYLEIKQIEKSLKFMKKALQMQPNNIQLLNFTAKLSAMIPSHHADAANRLRAIIDSNIQNAETYLIFGHLRYEQGFFENALSHYKNYLSLEPGNVEITLIVAKLTEQLSRLSEAHSSYNQLLINDPNNISYFKKLANILFQTDKFDELDSIVEKYSVIQPNLDVHTMFISAQSLFLRNHLSDALSVYNRIEDMYPSDISIEILLGIAAVYKQMHKYDEEIKYYSMVITEYDKSISAEIRIRIHSNLANAYAFLGKFTLAKQTLILCETSQLSSEELGNLALFYIAEANYKDALAMLNKSLAIDQYHKNSVFLMGFVQSKLGETITAMHAYSMCLRIDPKMLSAAINLSILQRSMNRSAAAQKTLLDILKHHPKNLQLTYHIALTYIQNNSPSLAVNVLHEAVNNYDESLNATQVYYKDQVTNFQEKFKLCLTSNDTDTQQYALESILDYQPQQSSCIPDLVQLHLLYAFSLSRSKHYHAAIVILYRCLSSDRTNVYYLYSLALSHYLNGEIDSAEAKINECIQINPKLTDKYCFALSNMIHHCKKKGYLLHEQRILQDTIAANERYDIAYSNLGSVCMQLQQYPLAVSAFQKYLQLRPNDADGLYNLGNALLYSGNKQAAVSTFQRCLLLSQNHYMCNYNLGLLNKANGKIQEAIILFSKCFELNPSDQRVFKNLNQLHRILLIAH